MRLLVGVLWLFILIVLLISLLWSLKSVFAVGVWVYGAVASFDCFTGRLVLLSLFCGVGFDWICWICFWLLVLWCCAWGCCLYGVVSLVLLV